MLTTPPPVIRIQEEVVSRLKECNQNLRLGEKIRRLLRGERGYTLAERSAYHSATSDFPTCAGTILAIQYEGEDVLLFTIWENKPHTMMVTEIPTKRSSVDRKVFDSLATDLLTIMQERGYTLEIPAHTHQ